MKYLRLPSEVVSFPFANRLFSTLFTPA